MDALPRNLDRIWAEACAGAGVEAAWELRLGDDVLSARHPGRMFSGASMVKTLLAALIDEDVHAGRVELSRPVQVTRQALVGEDGLLRFGQIPTMHRLSDLVLLMIAVSDNTATNSLIAFLGGPEAIDARLSGRGWTSQVLSALSDGPGGGAPGGAFSTVCLADHQAALAGIAHPLIVSAFRAQQDRRSLARHVRGSADFRHKTGTVGDVRHDAGVLATRRGPLWVGCFTSGGPSAEYVDHPACVAMGAALRATLLALDLNELIADLA